jgi:hypothetical protein
MTPQNALDKRVRGEWHRGGLCVKATHGNNAGVKNGSQIPPMFAHCPLNSSF